MKKIVWYSLIIILVAGASSCKKVKDNPFSDWGNFGQGTYLTLVKSINKNFNFAQINTSSVGITVDQYANGEAIDKILIYATKGSSTDTTDWHLVKTVPFTPGGTDLTVTGKELGTALGVDPTTFEAGSFYTFYNRLVTKSGRTFDVNNTSDNGGSAFINGPTYNGAFYFVGYITCPYSGSAAGTYKVIADDWVDWHPGNLVTVSDGTAANTVDLSDVWPNPAYGDKLTHLTVKVDPATGTATIDEGQVWGDYGSYVTSTLSGSSGYVFSCVGLITLSIHVSATGYGDQGFLRLILQKQ